MAHSADQIAAASKQWESADKDKFMTTMYQNMFAAHPEWLPLFKKFQSPLSTSDPAFTKQVQLTKVAFDKCMKLAAKNDMDALLKTLHDMAKRHVNYNVGQKEFQALKPVLSDTVGACVSGADKAAWSSTVNFVIDNIVVAD